jgi:hypothetical protein
MKDEKALLARRKAMQVLGVGLAAGGMMLIGGRSEAAAPPAPAAAPPAAKPAADAAALNCKDKAPIDETSKGLRRALQYKEKSDTADKACRLCAQFEGKKFGDCGSCKLFTGAVNPNGVCLSFAPLAAK